MRKPVASCHLEWEQRLVCLTKALEYPFAGLRGVCKAMCVLVVVSCVQPARELELQVNPVLGSDCLEMVQCWTSHGNLERHVSLAMRERNTGQEPMTKAL